MHAKSIPHVSSSLQMQTTKTPQRGFTLIEILITVGVVALISSIAVPAYTGYITRSNLAEGITALSNIVLQTEEEFQDSRNYNKPASICTTTPTHNNFLFSCSPNSTSYTWTATNKASVGLGSAGAYKYTIDQDGNKKTLAYKGSTVNLSCWKTSKSVNC